MATGPYYRGGKNLQPLPHEVRTDPVTRLLRTTHGVSVWDKTDGLEKFGGAYEVKQIPSDLVIIQRGKNPHHFEIVPARPMTFAEYDYALGIVALAPV
jgi:hypothetical protein